MTEIQRLCGAEDLSLLIEGDVVSVVVQNMPLWKYGQIEQLGVYLSGRHWGEEFLQFVIPAFMGREYAIVYMTRKESICVLDGSVVLNEDQSMIRSVNPETSLRYSELNQLLVNAGLRQDST